MDTPKINRKDEGINKKNKVNDSTSDFTKPDDLIDDLNKGKIDPLTEGNTNLGYEERAPRKKELEEKKHKDRNDL